ncbi:hypothetical protein IM538_21535 [Cytobacillus suaedae]|nr:hypothetical protein IM538_21535 [Cytobacillus suaedae]
MSKKKAIKVLTSTAIAATAFVAANPAQAASTTDAQTLVSKAKDAATVLKWAISMEGSADGTTRPWAQYNAAKDARDAAVAAVNKLSGSEKTALLADIEANVTLHINRTMAYIDAITAGEKISAKKQALEAKLAANVIDNSTEQAYHELSTEIRKQAILLDRVYGKSTRDAIRAAYKQSAEVVRDNAKFAVTVKIELDSMDKALAANNMDKAAAHLAEVEKFMNEVSNAAIKNKLADRKAALEAQLTPEVKSVSAINSKQLVVSFTSVLEGENSFLANDATDVANYTLDSVNPTSAKLSADKKSVTLTFAADVEGEDQVLVVNPVATTKKDANGDVVTTVKYSTILTYEDTVSPQVVGTSYVNGQIVVEFSEAVGTLPSVVRVNGNPVTAIAPHGTDANKVLVTYALSAGTTASLYVAGAKDSSVAQNQMSLYNGNVIAPAADTGKPQITGVLVTGQNTATVTLSEAVTEDTIVAKLQKGTSIYDVTLVKDSNDTDGLTYELTVDINGVTAGDGLFSGSTTSVTFDLLVAAEAMTDLSSNKNEEFITTVTFVKDTAAPALVETAVTADNKEFGFKFNEELVVAGSEANIVVKNSNGVKLTVDAATAVKSDDDKVYLVDITSGDVAIEAGTYTVSIPAGFFEDQYGNASAAITKTFTVGKAADAVDTTKPTATVGSLNNVFTVQFSEEVSSSALNLANYKLDGVALPAGTDIYFTSTTKDTVEIVLPEGSINIGNQSTGAAAVLNVANVQDLAGNTILTGNYNVTVEDNTAATISALQVIGTDVYVTFTEDVAFVGTVDADNVFNITVNNVVATAGNISLVTGNTKQVKFALDAAPATTPVVTVKATQSSLTDVNGVLVK